MWLRKINPLSILKWIGVLYEVVEIIIKSLRKKDKETNSENSNID